MDRFSALEQIASNKIVVSEVDENMVGQIRRFLASREEFGYSKDWDFVFNYSWKLKQFPYGYAILENGKTLAFLGTIFSERVIRGRRVTHCNITTWIVDAGFRSRLGTAGKGLGQLLIDPVLKMENVLITATTPNDRSRKTCERLGFRILEREQIMIPTLPWTPFTGREKRESVFITFNIPEIVPHLGEHDRTILAHHRSLDCTHFLIKDRESGGYCYGVATRTPIKKAFPPALHCLNLCYLSDSEVFVKCLNMLKKDLWTRVKMSLLRYDARLIPQRLSFFEYKIPRVRLFKHESFDPKDLDNLYTELVTRNSF